MGVPENGITEAASGSWLPAASSQSGQESRRQVLTAHRVVRFPLPSRPRERAARV